MPEYSCVNCGTRFSWSPVHPDESGQCCARCYKSLTKGCLVCYIRKIREHPLFPHLRIAEVNGNQIVQPDCCDPDILGVFMSEGSVLPDTLVEELKGRDNLYKKKVVSKEIGGVYSEGLFYPSRSYLYTENKDKVYFDAKYWLNEWKEGDNVSSSLSVGISAKSIKYKCLA